MSVLKMCVCVCVRAFACVCVYIYIYIYNGCACIIHICMCLLARKHNIARTHSTMLCLHACVRLCVHVHIKNLIFIPV